MEIENKIFREVIGEISANSVLFTQRVENRKLIHKLAFCYQAATLYNLETEDKKLITKLGQLYGFSYQKLLSDISDNQATVQDTEGFIRSYLEKPRKVVFLYDGKNCVNFVSERHKQVSMKKLHELVSGVLNKLPEFKQIDIVETAGGYKSIYEVGRTPSLSIRVNIDYGRNDAMGKASIRFEGGGHIFVCSNMIIPYVHKELKFSKNTLITKPKLIHTLHVSEHTKKNIVLLFNEAKDTALFLTDQLEASKSIKMARQLQIYILKLIEIKHKLGEKWIESVKHRLGEETETLYGLSQALTYVGTRADVQYAQRKLCEIGGQVVILGKELVPLLEKNLKEHKVDLVAVRNV
jgi:hypothetical protein